MAKNKVEQREKISGKKVGCLKNSASEIEDSMLCSGGTGQWTVLFCAVQTACT